MYPKSDHEIASLDAIVYGRINSATIQENAEGSEEDEEEENSVIEDSEVVPPCTNYTCDTSEVFGTVSHPPVQFLYQDFPSKNPV